MITFIWLSAVLLSQSIMFAVTGSSSLDFKGGPGDTVVAVLMLLAVVLDVINYVQRQNKK